MRGSPAHILLVLSLGAVCHIGQVVLLRELLMIFHGNELSLGIMLAAWMVWVGVGSRIGALIAGRTGRAAAPRLVAAASVALLPATVVLIRVLRSFFPVDPGAYLSIIDMLLASAVVTAPIGVLLGAQFVLLARIWRLRDRSSETGGADKTYVAEAVGNAIGGALFSLVLVRALNQLEIAVAAVLVMAFATLVATRRRRGRFHVLLWGAFIAALAAAPVLGQIDSWAYRLQWRSFSPEHELLSVYQSRYGAVSIARRDGQHSFFQSGNLLFSAVGAPDIAGRSEAGAGTRTAGGQPGTGAAAGDPGGAGRPGAAAGDPGGAGRPGAAAGDPRIGAGAGSNPAFEEHEAIVSAHFAMTQHPEPGRVLLIGGGLGGSLREILRHPVDRVDYVELDPVVTATARTYVHRDTIAAIDRDEVRLIHGDGRRFLRSEAGSYDLIIVDVPDPATAALNRYYTEEFFREAARRLEPNGVLAIGVDSTPGLRSAPVANRNATIFHTLRRVFPSILAAGDRHIRYFASTTDDSISADPATLRARYEERGVESPGFSPGQFSILLEEGPILRINEILLRHGRTAEAHRSAPDPAALMPASLEELRRAAGDLPAVNERYFINSDFRPIGYFHTLAFWNQLTRVEHAAAFRAMLRVRPWWIVPPILLCIGFVALLRLRDRRRPAGGSDTPTAGGAGDATTGGSNSPRARGGGTPRDGRGDEFPAGGAGDAAHRFAVLFAVFTTGLSTIALQIALLFTFQSVYGFVYEMIGLITAGFMAGLALGAAATHRLVRNRSEVRTLRAVQLAIAAFAVLIAVILPVAASVESPVVLFALFFALTVFAGVLNGVDFPLATACCLTTHRQAERATGAVYGTELFGACLGAIVAGVIVVPVLGIVAACLLAAIGNATAFVVLLVPGRSYGKAST